MVVGLETRVGVTTHFSEASSARIPTVSPACVRENHPGYDINALASCVATNSGGVNIEGANFAQNTAGKNFSAEGAFSGAPRSEIAGQLLEGTLTPGSVPVEVIVRNGQTLILNTRSATALAEAGIPRSQWTVVNLTGNAAAEARLTAQLARNGLTGAGTPTVKAK